MKKRTSLKTGSRGAKVVSVEEGPAWTFIKIKLPTDSLAAQGATKIVGGAEGRSLRSKIRAVAKRH